MERKCYINQPAGLGDIIFCQKIGYHYYNLGYDIVWGVNDVYLDDVKKYINSPFNFVKYDHKYNSNKLLITPNLVYLPLDGSERHTRKRIMESKYIISNVNDYSDWKLYFNINRDYNKENELFNLLGLQEDDEYALVNFIYGSPPNSLKMSGNLKNINMRKVEVEYIKGFSIFDWCKVIENAIEICITDSAMALLVEKLKPKKVKDYSIILRLPTSNEVQMMYDLDWEFQVGKR